MRNSGYNDNTEHIICIEVKYYSSKSGEGENDQLMRYFEALDISRLKSKTNFLGIIYLTMYPSNRELKKSLSCIKNKGLLNSKDKLFQLRWFEITRTIEKMLKEENKLEIYDKKILNDILKYLYHKNLVEFTKFSFVNKFFSEKIPNFYDFYEKTFNGFSFMKNEFNLKSNQILFYEG